MFFEQTSIEKKSGAEVNDDELKFENLNLANDMHFFVVVVFNVRIVREHISRSFGSCSESP